MLLPVLRRDCAAGPQGFVGAVVGPMLVVGLVTAIAALVYQDATMTEIVLLFGINAIMVVGYQVFAGNTGLVSFGHISFMAIGAYATAIVSIDPFDKSIVLKNLPRFLFNLHLSVIPSLLIGGVVAAVFALATGVALMRLSGAAASIATLGLLVITTNVLSQASEFTHGPESLFGVPQDTNFGWVFGTLAVAVLISGLFKWSRAGLQARANRDDVIAGESVGIGSLRARLVPFTLSAFLTGVAGGLYAMLLTAFSPASFAIPLVVVILTMAIVGGINSITGAVIGAALVTVLNELMRRVENGVTVLGVHLSAPTGISAAVLGVALILTLRWRPEGVMSAYELQFDRPRPPAEEPAAEGAAIEPASPAQPETLTKGDTHASQRV
jgi:branched-chain amino acid transport system permease protein